MKKRSSIYKKIKDYIEYKIEEIRYEYLLGYNSKIKILIITTTFLTCFSIGLGIWIISENKRIEEEHKRNFEIMQQRWKEIDSAYKGWMKRGKISIYEDVWLWEEIEKEYGRIR